MTFEEHQKTNPDGLSMFVWNTKNKKKYSKQQFLLARNTPKNILWWNRKYPKNKVTKEEYYKTLTKKFKVSEIISWNSHFRKDLFLKSFFASHNPSSLEKEVWNSNKKNIKKFTTLEINTDILNPKKTTIKTKKMKKKYIKKYQPWQRILLRFIEFYSMRGVLGKKEATNVLKYIQKYIISEDVTSKSTNAKLIMTLQNHLVSDLNNGKFLKRAAKPLVQKCEQIMQNYQIDPATKTVRAYINGGHEGNYKHRKRRLSKRKLNSRYGRQVIDNVHNGIQSLSGVDDVMTAQDLSNKTFEVFEIGGGFGEVFGKISLPVFAMIHGRPGGGKSTFSLALSNQMASQYKSVLYISKEEGYTATMKDKLERLGITSANLSITDRLVDNWADYDFVVVDSANSLRIRIEDFIKMISKGKATNTSILFVMQGTKNGDFRGSLEYEHEVDISLFADNGIISVNKNRFGGHGEYKVY